MKTLRLVSSTAIPPRTPKNNGNSLKSSNSPASPETSPTSPNACLLALLERLLELQPEMRGTMHRQLAFMVENAERIVSRNHTFQLLCAAVLPLTTFM